MDSGSEPESMRIGAPLCVPRTEPRTPMSIPLEEIVEGLRSGGCVLLLGPDVARNADGEWMQSGLLRHLKDQLNQREVKVEEDVDNLIKCDAQTRSRVFTLIRSYHERHEGPNELHRQLALIPFPLVISTTPDRLMDEALKQAGVPHDFFWYSMNEVHRPLERPSVERPLVYNLFGSIEAQQSMVLTHGDLLRFIFSVLGAFKPPKELTRAIQEAQYFVFLGFDFDKWYLQLLFELFLSPEKISIAVSRDSEAEKRDGHKDQWPDTVQPAYFYKDKYGVEFVEETIEEFVQALYDTCKARGLLRQVQEERRVSIADEIAEHIRRDEIEDALDRLYDFVDNDVAADALDTEKVELLNEINSHIGVITRSEKNVRRGIVSKEDAEVERQRVVMAIQSIVSEVDA
jgi:hypothetical protein